YRRYIIIWGVFPQTTLAKSFLQLKKRLSPALWPLEKAHAFLFMELTVWEPILCWISSYLEERLPFELLSLYVPIHYIILLKRATGNRLLYVWTIYAKPKE